MYANHGHRRPFRLLVITNETAQGDELCDAVVAYANSHASSIDATDMCDPPLRRQFKDAACRRIHEMINLTLRNHHKGKG